MRPQLEARAGRETSQSLAADPQHPGTLYAGTNVAVYKTVDGGRSWRPSNRGLFPPHGGARRCYRPAGATRRYCVKQPFGTPGTPGFNRGNGWVTAIAVDPANANIVYSGADAVRKSSDGGLQLEDRAQAALQVGRLPFPRSRSPQHSRSRSTRSPTSQTRTTRRSTSQPTAARPGERPAAPVRCSPTRTAGAAHSRSIPSIRARCTRRSGAPSFGRPTPA